MTKPPASRAGATIVRQSMRQRRNGRVGTTNQRQIGAGEVEPRSAEDVDERLEAGGRDVQHVAEPRDHEARVRQPTSLAVADCERPVQRQVHDGHQQEHADSDASTDPQQPLPLGRIASIRTAANMTAHMTRL